MNTPEWLKPGIYGAVGGAIFVAIVGFSWGGWMTGGGAVEMANDMSHDNVIAAMTPVCVGMSMTDTDRIEKLETIRAASSYRQRDAVMDTGWATMPGTEEPDRDLASACVDALDLDAA